MLILCQYSIGSLAEDNLLYLSADRCSPGQDGELTINLKNSEDVCGYGCTIYLPEGFTLKEITPITNRGGQEYFKQLEKDDGGMILMSVNIASNMYNFTGSDGPVAKVSVSVPKSIAPGEYEVQLKQISLANTGGTSLSVNESFTFKWSIQTTPYTITFDSNGGSPVDSITLGYGSTITPPANPTREGYTFQGWEPELPTVMPQKDMTLTAKWAVNSYTLTYVVDGEVYKTSSVNYGAAITPEAAPTKEGYTFSGWSEIPATMPAKNVEVTGTFKINSYILTYKVDGETYKIDTLNYATAITPLASPTKEGYTFSGWSEIPATMPANDVEVTGTFNINSYVITYKLDGAVYKRDTLHYATAITPHAAPNKEGYTFSGWSEIPAIMPVNDVEVTGTFKINSYILTYKVDGATIKIDTLNYATVITPLDAPTKEGYTFSGWSEEPTSMPANDVEVTGTFSINAYLLIYKVDGVVYHSDTIDFTVAVTPLADPTKEGYTFSGWSEIPATMPANDVEVTGTFNINSYVITYKLDGTVYKRDTLVYLAEITSFAAPAKEGYTFSGWSEIPATMPANDVEVTGTFSINKYLLTVLIDGETAFSDSIVFGTLLRDYIEYITKLGIDLSQWEWYCQIETISMPAYDVIINAVRDAVLSIGADLDKTAIYDLIGNKISTDHISTLPPGIYIRNGHKYIIK